MKKLKPLALLFLGALLFSSCKKSVENEPDLAEYGNHPRSAVPPEMVGQWIYGSFSLSSIVDNNGTWSSEYSLTYVLEPNGTCREYFQYANQPSYGLLYQVRGLRKGTVVVDTDAKTISFYAASGWYDVRRNYGSVERKTYGEADLYPTYFREYQYENTTDDKGRPALRLIDVNSSNTSGLLYTKS
ncbi:MAG TPA: hypothetical protein VGN63_13990 [Flavisolibacter sp.]|jgi:hypothetical protein|nr:hypothetical protein [Flavisolibacter sp.]